MVASRARRAALNVSGFALLLAAVKAAVGLLSGSIAVLSSALDSAADVLASFANFVFLTIAAKPADENHPFGHGKAEHLSALLQGVILLGGSVALGARAIVRIREPEPVQAGVVPIGVMIVSIFATIAITRYLKQNAAETESKALAGDALHYLTDIIANLATIAALVIVWLTGNPLFDSILGVSVACWIGWNSLALLWTAGNDLMDVALPDEEIATVVQTIERAHPDILGYRDLRTRRAAGVRFIEFELLILRSVSFEHAHELTELVKTAIRERFPLATVTVHAEPVQPA
jgi:ferrous-iron efflux pump FieF